ncbi:MAG TPA: hypothetical protein VGX49_08300 [Jatrophihabitans sp.]|nr:hypothetical protein [Jatrophihabitans sp.]
MDGATAVPTTGGRSSHRFLVRAVLPLAVALVLAGCSPAGTDHAVGDGNPSAILAHWRSFPVDADPRPPVLIGPTVIDPQSGFPSDEDREAYQEGRFDLATTLPAAPSTAGGYPVIAAKAALDQLRQAHPIDTFKGARTTPRLRIVAVTLGQAYFVTDRAPRRLPAWRFDLGRVTAPAWVLAVDPEALWAKPTPGADLGFRATLLPDGRSLSLDFIGGPDEATPCGIAYTAVAVESATAAVIRLWERQQRQPKGEGGCIALGYPRTVTLRLAAPLGARVLLSPYGVPMQVPGS